MIRKYLFRGRSGREISTEKTKKAARRYSLPKKWLEISCVAISRNSYSCFFVFFAMACFNVCFVADVLLMGTSQITLVPFLRIFFLLL